MALDVTNMEEQIKYTSRKDDNIILLPVIRRMGRNS
jgi:hypothetical protein